MESITTESFKSKVLDSKLPTLVDFNAEWCGPCQAQAPILEALSEQSDTYQIVSIDIDENPELAQKYEVSSIPCLVLFKDGTEVTRKTGLSSKSAITKLLKKV